MNILIFNIKCIYCIRWTLFLRTFYIYMYADSKFIKWNGKFNEFRYSILTYLDVLMSEMEYCVGIENESNESLASPTFQ